MRKSPPEYLRARSGPECRRRTGNTRGPTDHTCEPARALSVSADA